ncbi:MAG: aminoacyl-histidine dipeptidase [bacterium]|nr:aminoacyl-histidine dipeptidase [bacterium]
MNSPLEALTPRPVWSHFDAISQVPRPSKHEERIAAHVREWAERQGFGVQPDASGNMVVSVPATSGRESAPVVVLQAHLDMVCEKNSGVEHDFMTDPIRVAVDGDWVVAEGTTLGADNGLGAAAAMAVAVDGEVVHGPLELLFTLDEETGLNGASALDPAIVSGKLLVNLDTEEDDAVYIGCAGSAGVEATVGLRRVGAGAGERLVLSVRGLRGGHSGLDIIENRGNAIKAAARVLIAALDSGTEIGLVAFDGGSKRNAIARECFAHLVVEREHKAGLEEALRAALAELRGELGQVEPNLEIVLESADADAPSWPPVISADRDRLLRTIAAAPHGVIAMSRDVAGLVETSNNLGVVRTAEESATVLCSFRSSVNAALAGTMQSLRSLFLLAGAEVSEDSGYPGWKPNPDSPLVRRTVDVYERLFGEPPEIKAVHAGLECGILAEKVPGLDAVSIGPLIRNAHSPEEKANIPSVGKFYSLLKELLDELATA